MEITNSRPGALAPIIQRSPGALATAGMLASFSKGNPSVNMSQIVRCAEWSLWQVHNFGPVDWLVVRWNVLVGWCFAANRSNLHASATPPHQETVKWVWPWNLDRLPIAF